MLNCRFPKYSVLAYKTSRTSLIMQEINYSSNTIRTGKTLGVKVCNNNVFFNLNKHYLK